MSQIAHIEHAFRVCETLVKASGRNINVPIDRCQHEKFIFFHRKAIYFAITLQANIFEHDFASARHTL